MAEYLTVARPYAKALYAQASSHNTVDAWLNILYILGLVADNKNIQHMVADPTVSSQRIIDMLHTLCQEVSPSHLTSIQQPLANFLALLCQDKRLVVLPAIFELYQRMVAENAGVVNVEITSAADLAPEQQDKIMRALEKRFAAKIDVTYKLDESLIGGVLLRADNWVMDGSIKGKLARLKETI